MVTALTEYAKHCVEAGVTPASFRRQLKLEELFSYYSKDTPGAAWNGNYYRDVQTGLEKKNHALIYQDTYIFGKGYLGNTSLQIPEKYLKIK